MPASMLPPCGGTIRRNSKVTHTAIKHPQPIRRLRARGVTVSATRAPHAATVMRVSGQRATRSRTGGTGIAIANDPPSVLPVYQMPTCEPDAGLAHDLPQPALSVVAPASG